MKHSSKSGFALIEILIVVVIIGLLTAIGITKFGGAKDRAQAATAKAITTQLNKCIQQAIIDDNWTTLSSSLPGDTGQITPAQMTTLATELASLGYISQSSVQDWTDFVTTITKADNPILIAEAGTSSKYTITFTTTARSDATIVQAASTATATATQ